MAWEIPPLRDDMTILERFSRWVQIKIYQFEMTFAVYIFEPVEKFIFYSVIFLLTSSITIGVILYFPQHISFIVRRAMFYLSGDASHVAVNGTKDTVGQSLTTGALEATAIAIKETATKAADAVAEATRTMLREL